MANQLMKGQNKEFASELTTTLIDHYVETGKKFVWVSVAREDGMFPYDFAIQLRRAEMQALRHK